MFIIDDLDLVKCFKVVSLFHQPYKHINLIHKLVVKLHVIRTKENNDRYFATRVIMDIILPPW